MIPSLEMSLTMPWTEKLAVLCVYFVFTAAMLAPFLTLRSVKCQKVKQKSCFLDQSVLTP